LELQTLRDLGLEDEALVLAREVSSSSAAKPQDRAQAALLVAAGAPVSPVLGDQLLQEGLEKKEQRDFPAAQRLFDRARLALERKASAKAILEPKGGLWDVSAMTWAADGTKLAVAAGKEIRILRSGDYQETLRLQANAAPVVGVAFSPDSQTLASSAADHNIALWDLRSGSRAGTIECERGGMQTLSFSPDFFSMDGGSLASASRDKTARVWDVSTWKGRRLLEHPQALNSVAYRADGRILATGGDDGVVRLWDVKSGDTVAVLPGSRCGILTVGFSPDSSMLLANTGDHSVLRWDANTHAPLPRVERAYNCSGELRSWTNTLGLTADGKLVTSAPSGEIVELWNAQTGQMQGSLTESGHTLHIRSVAVSPRDSIVVAAGGDRINVWQLPGKNELPALTAPNGADSLAFSSDGRFLFGASRRGAVSIWAMPSGRLEVTLKLVGDSSAFAISTSGLVEWLGSKKPDAACKLRERWYPAELCEERYAASALIGAALSGQDIQTVDD
jgi:WD40 repeat protein